jgi:hypothetical protein
MAIRRNVRNNPNRESFAIVNHSLIGAFKTLRQMRVWCVLSEHAGPDHDGQAWPSAATIGRTANIDEAAVHKALRALEAIGHIKRVGVRKMEKTIIYEVIRPLVESTIPGGIDQGANTPVTPGSLDSSPLVESTRQTDHITDHITDQRANAAEKATETTRGIVTSKDADPGFGTFNADVDSLLAIELRQVPKGSPIAHRRKLASWRQQLGDDAFARGLRIAVERDKGVGYARWVMTHPECEAKSSPSQQLTRQQIIDISEKKLANIR